MGGEGEDLTWPPLGWYLMLSVDPILDLTFLRSGRGWLRTRSCLGVVAGDLGGVRITATFLSWDSRLREGGVPGVRQEKLGGVPGVMAVDPGVRGAERPLRAEPERTDSAAVWGRGGQGRERGHDTASQ